MCIYSIYYADLWLSGWFEAAVSRETDIGASQIINQNKKNVRCRFVCAPVTS